MINIIRNRDTKIVYACVQAEVETPEEWHGSKYAFDNGTWTLV